MLPPVFVTRGDATGGAGQSAPHAERYAGGGRAGAFYLEGQVAYVVPQEQNQWLVSSARSTRRSAALGISRAGAGQPRGARGVPAHGRWFWRQGNAGRAHGRVGRAGRTQAQHPVKLRMADRDDDFMVTGKRTIRLLTNTPWVLTTPDC